MVVPEELAVLPQWVTWKLEKRHGKLTKIPYQCNGRKAEADNPETWTTFAEASAASPNVGFVLQPPYIGIDLDHCVENGVVHPEAQEVVDYYDSYTHLSPSGTGLHIIAKGHVGKQVKERMPWGGNLEAWDHNHYLTFTDDSLNGLEIKDAEFWHPGDERIIRNCRLHSDKFEALFDDGDCSNYKSESEADIALANIFAARTPDGQQIERLLRRSALAREKWDTPDTGSINLWRRVIEPALRDRKPSRDASPTAWTGTYEEDVQKQLYVEKVRSEAKSLLAAEEALRSKPALPPVGYTLKDAFEAEEVTVEYVVDPLQVVGHNVLMVAKYKLGKTTITQNLARCLVDGTDFLRYFKVRRLSGRVAIWNYELLPAQWNEWMSRMDIQHPEQIIPVHLRGKGTIPIWHPEVQEEVIEWMRASEVEYWIIDPTVKAWGNLLRSEGDNMGAAKFLDAIDEVKEKSGISNALLSHHTGRSEEAQERGRGVTRLEDWMDYGWYLTGVKDAVNFHADGRGPGMEKIRLSYSEEDLRTFSTDAEPMDEADSNDIAFQALVALYELEKAGVPLEKRITTAVTAKLKMDSNDKKNAVPQATSKGWIKREDGSGKAKLCSTTQLGRRELEKKGLL